MTAHNLTNAELEVELADRGLAPGQAQIDALWERLKDRDAEVETLAQNVTALSQAIHDMQAERDQDNRQLQRRLYKVEGDIAELGTRLNRLETALAKLEPAKKIDREAIPLDPEDIEHHARTGRWPA